MKKRTLTDEQADEIRKSGDTHKALAERFGVSAALIKQIKDGKSYAVATDDDTPIWLNKETLRAIAYSTASQRILMQQYGLSQPYVSMIQRIVRCFDEK